MGCIAPFFIILLIGLCSQSAIVDQKYREIGYSGEMQNEFINSELQFTASHAIMLHNSENPMTDSADTVSTGKELVTEARGRLPFMLPVMYNLGVITTLLVVLTFLMFKGLTLGIIILILNLNGKAFKQTPTRPVHIHVHGGSKPSWNQVMDGSNTTDTMYQMYYPRGYSK